MEHSTLKRRGLTGFTYLRYMVPYYMGYKGRAVFMDSDMIVRADIHELDELDHGSKSVSVVKKIPEFEWPSLMVFNCELCQELTPEYIEDEKNNPAKFNWAESIGELPPHWNFCAGYSNKETSTRPSLIHYTAGIPYFPENRYCDYSEEWWEEYRAMQHTCSWMELMGGSVHLEKVMKEIKERNREDYLRR